MKNFMKFVSVTVLACPVAWSMSDNDAKFPKILSETLASVLDDCSGLHSDWDEKFSRSVVVIKPSYTKTLSENPTIAQRAEIRLENLPIIEKLNRDRFLNGTITPEEISEFIEVYGVRYIISDYLSHECRPENILQYAIKGHYNVDIIRAIISESADFAFEKNVHAVSGNKLYMQSPLSCVVQSSSNFNKMRKLEEKDIINAQQVFELVLEMSLRIRDNSGIQLEEMSYEIDPLYMSLSDKENPNGFYFAKRLIESGYSVNLKEPSDFSGQVNIKNLLPLDIVYSKFLKEQSCDTKDDVFISELINMQIEILRRSGRTLLDTLNLAINYMRTNPENSGKGFFTSGYIPIFDTSTIDIENIKGNLSPANRNIYGNLVKLRHQALVKGRGKLIPSIEILNSLISGTENKAIKEELRYIRDDKVRSGFLTMRDTLDDHIKTIRKFFDLNNDIGGLMEQLKVLVNEKSRTSEMLKNEWGIWWRGFFKKSPENKK